MEKKLLTAALLLAFAYAPARRERELAAVFGVAEVQAPPRSRGNWQRAVPRQRAEERRDRDGTPTQATISGNYVEQFQKTGIVVHGRVAARIQDNFIGSSVSSRCPRWASAATSSSTGSSRDRTISSADPTATRRRPGSPWMPIPSSISSSANVNDGSPACGTVHAVNANPIDLTCDTTRRANASHPSRSTPRCASPVHDSASTPRRPKSDDRIPSSLRASRNAA